MSCSCRAVPVGTERSRRTLVVPSTMEMLGEYWKGGAILHSNDKLAWGSDAGQQVPAYR